MEPTEQKERFIELRAQGFSFDKIAKELGKAKQTLIDWSRELQDEIANRKAMELDTLYEKYYLHKANRLQTFGELLTRIREEIAGKNGVWDEDTAEHYSEFLRDWLTNHILMEDMLMKPVLQTHPYDFNPERCHEFF